MLRTSDITILATEYSALKDNNVVMEPAPAINGNANGTIEALPEL